MAILRRPVSQRRQARRPSSIKARLPYRDRSTKYDAYKRIDTSRGTNPQHMVVHRGIGFPEKFRTRLVWSESVVLSSFAANTTSQYVVRLNGPYDPQSALGGSQPPYYDQLAEIYNSYLVKGAKISVSYALPAGSAAGDGPYIVGIQCGRLAGIPTANASKLMSAPNTGHKLLMAGGNPVTVTQTYSPRILEPTGEGDDIQSETTTVPARQWYASVFASPQGASTAGTVNAIITVEYLVDFFELKSKIDG